MSHLNLMSDQAKVRECCRIRLRQWSFAWGALLAFLALTTVVLYLPCYRNGIERDALEVRAEVVVKLRTANKKLAQELERIQNEEQFALGLSHKVPVVTALGLVSGAVAKEKERLFIEQLRFEGVSVTSKNTAPHTTVLSVAGTAMDEPSVTRFAESMRGAFPFASVRLGEVQKIPSPDHTLHGFSLECSF